MSNRYIHIGNEVIINSDEIIGVFDIENTSVAKCTRDYLTECEKNKKIYYVSYDLPRTFIVCKETNYITNISPQTIRKRLMHNEL